ncbi:MAG: Eco57I restriction-modification methylase domain-containing protein [Cytophagia bacterium]|nr:Eco57I restriction-modification methylase domain-containing protein [Cytophagia bacterium]
MNLNIRKSLNKAFLRVKPNRTQIEEFKKNLIQLLDRTNEIESEEFHKNLVSDFLKRTYYDPEYFINTKGRNDLVIHTGKSAKTPVGVIVEAKKPTNKAEMLSNVNINTKAFQELVLYFLRERIAHKNLEIKNLIASNINEWFVFDANVFEKKFAQNKKLVKQFEDFEAGRLAGKTTDFFYKEIAQPFIEPIKGEIEYTYFDLRDYEKPLRKDNPKDDSKLIALFKILSPEHLLKLPFVNDSNSLDKKFYAELLHIIGLTETKEKGKKVIERKAKGERNEGALLENAIVQLDVLDKISRLDKPSQYGETTEERLFNVGLELSITWVNRILFLKLLEAQLISYHKGDKAYSFLNVKKISDYDALNRLFFQVLAKRVEDRREEIVKEFEFVPYLNSSLFEPNEMEHNTILISNLMDEKTLPILSNTVLKDATGKKRKGELNAIEYFFEFLDAYDFSSEGKEDIQEDNKTLINASVLGLIFEKINGYKDGSFFTPGFITMYMCRETIRRSVVQKFNEAKGWNCTDLDQLYDKIEDRQEANNIINSLKICDPAVGSGHFLVSALNEIIAIKNDLKVLQDREGRRLKEYQFEVVNDELIITDEDGEFFEYSPSNKESQRVQETLFHEKQTIIENCLFGVDINPNSVKICRLRLWIELLKNAYYKTANELETLPNIDINIKCGNSLISRFDLDADIQEALKKSKWSIDSYKVAVNNYRNAQSKEEKHEMEHLINDIKSDFRSEISKNDPKLKRLYKLNGELANLTTQTSLFDMAAKEKKLWKKKVEKLTADTQKLETEIEEIKNNKIFENAFEWRFEFPEVLNEQGEFIGFDCVIGNPPYIRVQNLNSKEVDFYFKQYVTPKGKLDISVLFFERALNLLEINGSGCYISSSQWTQTDYGMEIRRLLSEGLLHKYIDFGSLPVFEEADTYPAIFCFGNSDVNELFYSVVERREDLNYEFLNSMDFAEKSFNLLSHEGWNFAPLDLYAHLNKLNISFKPLSNIGASYIGLLTGMDKAFVVTEEFAKSKDFEKEVLFPYGYRGDEISAYNVVETGSSVIYPYQLNEDGSEALILESEFQSLYPKVFNHILEFKDELKQRKDSRKLYADGDSWYRHLRKGGFNLIEPKKLLVKGVATRMSVGLLSEHSAFNGANCPAIILKDQSLNEFYFLGLLNSKLIGFFMNSICPKKLGGYFRYNAKSLAKIPIVIPEGENENRILNKVLEILSLKKVDSNADTSALEAEIDQMVYALYGLTEEEIAIVEEAVN